MAKGDIIVTVSTWTQRAALAAILFLNAPVLAQQSPAAAETKAVAPPARAKSAEPKSPFTRETVLKLNAITARSKDAIEAFDAVRPTIEKYAAQKSARKPDKKTAKAIARLDSIAADADRARIDMLEAEKVLKASGEPFSAPTLAAIVSFTVGVHSEIHAAKRELTTPAVAAK